ncbi:hypothetical protein FSP39_007705 [Pinctada imbricata]|uniref:Uncharacterized protein n=1 Tax=Pinctada imbricata TaxID=66713 RepID=A0AA89C5J3_PINIB|nr:hypothetical protein FSP39_007705 [Pinctada imbricata]
MTDICLTPFKRRFVENWRKTVQKHLDDGSICRIVVAQIEEDDEDVEPPAKVQEPPPTPRGDRSRTRPPNREKSASEKLAELAVNSSLHIKALPSVNFAYTNGNDQKLNVVNKRPKSRSRKEYEEEKGTIDETEDKQPIVIVDPQLMTPTGNTNVNVIEEQNVKTVEKSVKFPLRITSVSKPNTETNKYNKSRLPLFAKCKIQSADQNSFVVSRSNLLKKGNLQNHSFLTLPVRFQVQSQHGERLNMRNSTESLLVDRERSALPAFRNTGVRLIKKLSNLSGLHNISGNNRNSPRLMAW